MIAADDLMTDTTDTEPEAPTMDPEAPYGRKLDGTPKRRAGGRPPTGRSKPSGPTRVAAAPPRRKTPNRPRSSGTDYTTGIQGLLQLASLPLALGGRFRPTLALDAAAVSIHSAPIAQALNDLAQDRPEVAGALDTILKAGPYGAIIASVLPLIAQVAVNHQKLPESVGVSMGAIPVEELTGMLRERAAADAD